MKAKIAALIFIGFVYGWHERDPMIESVQASLERPGLFITARSPVQDECEFKLRLFRRYQNPLNGPSGETVSSTVKRFQSLGINTTASAATRGQSPAAPSPAAPKPWGTISHSRNET